jgi:hypothetical protein
MFFSEKMQINGISNNRRRETTGGLKHGSCCRASIYLLLPRLSTCCCRVCQLVVAASVYLLLPRLLLEELVAHGVEGDGQPAPEEQDEVDGQLVPGTTTRTLLSQMDKNKVYLQQCCGSGMFIPDPHFFHPGSRIRTFPIP